MTSSVGITHVAPSATAQASAVPTATTSSTAPTPAATAAAQAVSISPRIIDDPTAGIITQYLDSTGKVANQFPSTTVVAYLRAGLTADGLSRHAANGAEAKSTGTFA